jgi:hypothetical protein
MNLIFIIIPVVAVLLCIAPTILFAQTVPPNGGARSLQFTASVKGSIQDSGTSMRHEYTHSLQWGGQISGTIDLPAPYFYLHGNGMGNLEENRKDVYYRSDRAVDAGSGVEKTECSPRIIAEVMPNGPLRITPTTNCITTGSVKHNWDGPYVPYSTTSSPLTFCTTTAKFQKWQDLVGVHTGTFPPVLDNKPCQISISVSATPNSPPIANAGPDQEDVYEGDVVTLNGSASSDPDGDPITYSWSQVAGPQVTLKNLDSPSPTFSAPNIGESGTSLSPTSASTSVYLGNQVNEISSSLYRTMLFETEPVITFMLTVKDDKNAKSSPAFVHVKICAEPSDWPKNFIEKQILDISKKAIKNEPLTSGEILFLKSFYYTLAGGGSLLYPEAAQLLNRYLTPSKTGDEIINPIVYENSPTVQKEITRQKSIVLKSASQGNNVITLKSKTLFADYPRLKNANNRFILQSRSTIHGISVRSVFTVRDDYSFEPFAKCLYKGFYTDFDLHLTKLRVPDGLSQYLTKIGLAKDFFHVATWEENWSLPK